MTKEQKTAEKLRKLVPQTAAKSIKAEKDMRKYVSPVYNLVGLKENTVVHERARSVLFFGSGPM